MYTELRKKILLKRRKILSTEQQTASKKIMQKILASKIFKQSKKIAFYLATAGEIETRELITKALAAKKQCFLPVVSNNQQLLFIRYFEGDALSENKWHILEPQYDKTKLLAPEELDLVIVPLVGFNENNFRLGRGKGYYDKTFAFKLIQPKSKPYLLGAAYSWQKVDFVPQPWDVPMQEIITNN